MSFKDKVTTTDHVKVSLDRSTEVNEPCPKCGKGSREHVEGQRICALCRHVFLPKSKLVN